MTVGYLKGGQARNVIPESVEFGGTYRSLSPEGLTYLQNRIREVIINSFNSRDHVIQVI